jgi:hypothetical protein
LQMFRTKIVFSPHGSISPDERGARLYQTNINNPQQSWKNLRALEFRRFTRASIRGKIVSIGMAGAGWKHSFSRDVQSNSMT